MKNTAPTLTDDLLLPEGLPFEIVMPLFKGLTAEQPDGSYLLGGVASDRSLDLQNERVPPSLLEKCLPYLSDWGKVNWNHRQDDIGDVLEARLVSPAEIAKDYGRRIEGDGTFIRSRIYPLVDPALASDDLKLAHHRIRAGARLGWSLQGTAVRKSGRGIMAVFANKVALCPQAINTNSFATVLAKSLSAVMEALDGDQAAGALETAADENPRYVIACDGLEGQDAIGTLPSQVAEPGPGQVVISQAVLSRLVKSAIMCAGGGVDAAEFQGGRALGQESLEGQAYCERCGRKHRGAAGDKCPHCGTPLQDITTKVAKSLEFLLALEGGNV